MKNNFFRMLLLMVLFFSAACSELVAKGIEAKAVETPVEIYDMPSVKYMMETESSGSIAKIKISFDINFTIDKSAKDVWLNLKDFNLWQEDIHYTGIVGDSEGKTVYLGHKTMDKNAKSYSQPLNIMKVIPEHFIFVNMQNANRAEAELKFHRT